MCAQCNLDDLSSDLSDALAESQDAATMLGKAQDALHYLDPIEAVSKLNSAVSALRDALKVAEAALEPLGHMADRASGDW